MLGAGRRPFTELRTNYALFKFNLWNKVNPSPLFLKGLVTQCVEPPEILHRAQEDWMELRFMFL